MVTHSALVRPNNRLEDDATVRALRASARVPQPERWGSFWTQLDQCLTRNKHPAPELADTSRSRKSRKRSSRQPSA